MHRVDIYAALVKAGWPPIKLATHLNVSPSAISQTISKEATSYNIASAISVKTGIPLKTLWPCGKYSRPSHGNRTGRKKHVA